MIMLRKGFTVIELVVASTISGFILTALCVAIVGVTRQAHKTNEELQAMVLASAARDKLLLGMANKGVKGFHGLANITNFVKTANSGKRLEVSGADAKYESLPGSTSFVFGQTAKNSKNSFYVKDLGIVTNSFGCAEQRQLVRVYLWVETSAGSVCRMPVTMTVLSDGGS